MGPLRFPAARGPLPPKGADFAWDGPARNPVPPGSPAARVSHSRATGFTLIELLVAITIMSMLALLSWRSLDGMTRTQAQTQQRADDLLRFQAALGQWTADLDAIVDTREVTPLVFDGRLLRLCGRIDGDVALLWALDDGDALLMQAQATLRR